MQKIFYILLTSLFVEFNFGQSIKISVFNERSINSYTISIKQGVYFLKSEKGPIGEYKRGAIFHISRIGEMIEVRDKRNFIGKFKEIDLSDKSNEGIVIVKPVNPLMDGIEYDDNVIVRCVSEKLQLLNRVDMEKYIAAVIEAEGGNHSPAEYYKAQAVLIRTYTIKNMFKHAEEGFNLCDQVHCQAYKGRSSQNPDILEATQSTAGKVLIDNDSVLVMSPFHSNCGRETSAAGMVWQKNLPYLQSVVDPFCTSSSHNKWSVTISRNDWISFLKEYTSGENFYALGNFSFNLIHRTRNVMVNGIDINLRAVREKFNLKSTFFSIADTGKEIVVNGRGYGHGVGMCQEGAIEMARVGYTWLDIIHFYYQHVEIADYRDLELDRY